MSGTFDVVCPGNSLRIRHGEPFQRSGVSRTGMLSKSCEDHYVKSAIASIFLMSPKTLSAGSFKVEQEELEEFLELCETSSKTCLHIGNSFRDILVYRLKWDTPCVARFAKRKKKPVVHRKIRAVMPVQIKRLTRC